MSRVSSCCFAVLLALLGEVTPLLPWAFVPVSGFSTLAVSSSCGSRFGFSRATIEAPQHIHSLNGHRCSFDSKVLCSLPSSTLHDPFRSNNSINIIPSNIARKSGSLALSSGSGASTNESAESASNNNSNILDKVLSSLTSCFPFFVLAAAICGMYVPSSLMWVSSNANIIPLMLASVMMGTGMTLEKRDFTNVLSKNFASVPAGVLCQFLIMPLAAYTVGSTTFLNNGVSDNNNKALFFGLLLVGCSPGGTASNLVSFIAGADVALSVLLTACSTLLASAVTPLLVRLLAGSTVRVSSLTLCVATARVVLLPVLTGMVLNTKAPRLCRQFSRFTPLASVLLVAVICGGVVAQNAAAVVGTTVPLGPLLRAVFLLHTLGFFVGYLVPRRLLGFGERTSRTMSIETGMQNSALAVVLAQSVRADPLSSLPGAISATMHSCLGSILAAYWRWKDYHRGTDDNEGEKE